MLRYRVIPIVLLDSYSVVKTIRFDVRRNLGNPITVARVYDSRGVDELILLDIDASKQSRGIDLHTVEAVAKECFMPLTVGGGIKTSREISSALKAGADKVSLNTVLFENPDFFREAVSVFGSQCIVASVDVRKNNLGEYRVFSHAGKGDLGLNESLELLVRSKVGEILLNSVDQDGVMNGYDYRLIEYAASIVRTIPIIAAGGASAPQDCAKAVQAGASAVAASSMFHFTSITPRMCKESMQESGLLVRL